MLVEALDEAVQGDVRLGLLGSSAAGALARLPRDNQKMAADVVIRHGLTVRGARRLVADHCSTTDFLRLQSMVRYKTRASGLAAPVVRIDLQNSREFFDCYDLQLRNCEHHLAPSRGPKHPEVIQEDACQCHEDHSQSNPIHLLLLVGSLLENRSSSTPRFDLRSNATAELLNYSLHPTSTGLRLTTLTDGSLPSTASTASDLNTCSSFSRIE